MATRKTTAKRSSRKAPAKKQSSGLNSHFWSVMLFAIGVLVLLFALIPGESAWLSIHNLLRGLFGGVVFLVPVILIYAAVMIALDKSGKEVAGRLIEGTVLVILLCGAVEILFVGELVGNNWFQKLGLLFKEGKELRGGGLVSYPVAAPLLALFHRTGAAIFVCVITFVFIMLFSGRSLLDFFGLFTRPAKHIAHTLAEAGAIRAENRALRQEEQRSLPREDTRAIRGNRGAVASAARAQETSAGGGEFIPPPGAGKKQKGKQPPNSDVPKELLNRPVEDFDIPVNDVEILPQHPVASPKITPDKLEETVKNANSELEQLIKKAVETTVAEPTATEISGDEKQRKDKAAEAVLAALAAEESGGEPPKEEVSSETPPWEEIPPQSQFGALEEPADEEVEGSIEPPKPEPIPEPEIFKLPETPPEPGPARLYQQNDRVSVYQYPPVGILKLPDRSLNGGEAEAELKQNADILVDTLKSFGVQTRIVDIHRGPSVTRYELQPSAGVKISKITGLSDDIALNLAAAGVRIEAPIPGKAAVGIEIPNKVVDVVTMGELVDTPEFQKAPSKVSFALGRDITGNTVIADIARMPHVLIAGSTGSGKSVCINSIIMSLLYKASPDQVRILMIDPKVVELGIYNGIPHLLIPVVTDPKKAAGALAWAVNEMLKRYKMFADSSVRDIKGYNEHAGRTIGVDPLPQIVIIIDELADLMMAAPGEVEDSICRLAQMARAAGMHLVIATQRPSVDIITGVIKANIPSRIAFAVSSQVDSRTILDGAGAEKLLGRGDMLFYPSGVPKPIRVQGCFVTDGEVESVVSFIKRQSAADYDQQIIQDIDKNAANVKGKGGSIGEEQAENSDLDGPGDEMLEQAIDCVMEAGQASTSYLQRRLKLGYARAARIMDELEKIGVIGSYEGAKPRTLLMSKEQWSERKLRKTP